MSKSYQNKSISISQMEEMNHTQRQELSMSFLDWAFIKRKSQFGADHMVLKQNQ